MAATTVRDLKLGADGDLLVVGGDLVLVRGTEAILQAISNRLQLFKGEWFLDLNEGMPWYQQILIKNPDINALQGVFRDRIAGTSGVKSLDSLTLLLDRARRTLTVTYTATTDVGLIGATVVL